jgi:hypothetical protein
MKILPRPESGCLFLKSGRYFQIDPTDKKIEEFSEDLPLAFRTEGMGNSV